MLWIKTFRTSRVVLWMQSDEVCCFSTVPCVSGKLILVSCLILAAYLYIALFYRLFSPKYYIIYDNQCAQDRVNLFWTSKLDFGCVGACVLPYVGVRTMHMIHKVKFDQHIHESECLSDTNTLHNNTRRNFYLSFNFMLNKKKQHFMSFMLKGILRGRVHCRVVSALDTTLQMEGSKLRVLLTQGCYLLACAANSHWGMQKSASQG